jgi:hypothetical protein
MRFTTDILTSHTAFCLISNGSDLTVREEQFHQLAAEESTARLIVVDTVFIEIQFHAQTGDREVNRVNTPGKGARSGSEALEEPIFLKQPLLFASNSLNLTPRSRNTLNCAAASLHQRHEARLAFLARGFARTGKSHEI